jgi:hypothetical protein
VYQVGKETKYFPPVCVPTILLQGP